jgi:hypothetical protein
MASATAVSSQSWRREHVTRLDKSRSQVQFGGANCARKLFTSRKVFLTHSTTIGTGGKKLSDRAPREGTTLSFSFPREAQKEKFVRRHRPVALSLTRFPVKGKAECRLAPIHGAHSSAAYAMCLCSLRVQQQNQHTRNCDVR